jgi:hypothetical protein
MSKMGIILAIFTVLGIGAISIYYSNKEVTPLAPVALNKWHLDLDKPPAAPGNTVLPKVKDQVQIEKKKSIGGSSGGDFVFATPIPTPVSPPSRAGEIFMSKDASLETQKFYVKVVFSGMVLVASLIVVFKGGNADAAKWAFGSVGTILGYWLK